MADDILTRNAAGELTVRTTQTTGDTGTNKDDVYTRDSQGRLAVRTTGNGGGGSGGASSAADLSVNPAGMSVITTHNAQSAFQELDSATKALQDSVSVLTTSANLSTNIGGTTTVALSKLTAMDIDGRPSYKQAGATVYSDNGVVGIIDTVDSTNAVITTVSTSASVSKGHTWTKSQVIEYDEPANLVLNFGELADGNYEFLIKNPYGVSTTAWGLRFRITNGEINYYDNTSFYFPLPQLATAAKDAYATKDFRSYPILFGKVENNWLFVGYSGYSNSVPGSVSSESGNIFEFTDLLNLDTGEYIPVVENSVFYGYETPVEGVPQEYRGESSYRPDISVQTYNTSTPWYMYDYNDPNAFQALQLDLIGTDWDINYDFSMNGSGYRAKNRIYMINRETNDVCLLELSVCVGTILAKVIKATGVFAGLDWKVMWNNTANAGWYLTSYLIYADGYIFNTTAYSVAFYGSTGNGTIGYANINTWEIKPTCDNEISFTKEKAPTADSSAYTLCHDNGLIEMGGIVPITDTLQPDVALGNIPVVFPNELANANFVPTITVMTDGTFKQVMADVANPTTTGFDLCVRNVDTEAVSGIKVAWKIVGTNK